MTAAVPTAQHVGFDYNQLDDAAADAAKAAVDRYRGRAKAYVIDTGRDLLGVKERLEHGQFTAWVEAEMGITIRTAQKMMSVATEFGGKSELGSRLPPSILYALAAPSTPAPVREDIVRRLEAREPIPILAIGKLIDNGKAQAKEAGRRAKLTTEERKAEDTQKKRRLTIAQKKAVADDAYQREYDDLKSKKAARATEAAKILIDALGPDGATDFAKRYRDVFWEMQRLLAGESD